MNRTSDLLNAATFFSRNGGTKYYPDSDGEEVDVSLALRELHAFRVVTFLQLPKSEQILLTDAKLKLMAGHSNGNPT